MSFTTLGNAGANALPFIVLGYSDAGSSVRLSAGRSALGNAFITLDYWAGSAWSNFAEVSVAQNPAVPTTFRVVADNGQYKCYINGDLVDTIESAHVIEGTNIGVVGDFGNHYLDAISVSTDIPPTLTIDPTTFWYISPANVALVTLHNEQWTFPSDGSVSISVDHGTVVFGVLLSSTQAQVWFTPGLYVGTVTFTESVYGATGTALSTVTPQPDSGGGYPLTEDGAGIVNRTADDCPEGTLLSTCTMVNPAEPVHLLNLINTISWQLGGFNGCVPGDIGPVSLPAEIKELSAKVGESGYWTAAEVLELLGGSPIVYSHKDIIDAIPATVETDLTPVTDKLALIQPSTSYSLSTVAAQNVALAADLGGLTTTVAGIVSDLAALAEAVNAIRDLLPTTTPFTAPVWPGIDNVTLGDPVALTPNLVLTDDLDGIIVTITTPPVRTGQYQLGNRILYYGMGRVTFIDDQGHAEPWQYLAWASEVITPQHMAHASGAVFQVLGGAEGTVTPWVMSAPPA